MGLAIAPEPSVHGRVAQHLIYVRRSYKEATAADVSDELQEAAGRAVLPVGASVRVISDSGGHHRASARRATATRRSCGPWLPARPPRSWCTTYLVSPAMRG